MSGEQNREVRTEEESCSIKGDGCVTIWPLGSRFRSKPLGPLTAGGLVLTLSPRGGVVGNGEHGVRRMEVEPLSCRAVDR